MGVTLRSFFALNTYVVAVCFVIGGGLILLAILSKEKRAFVVGSVILCGVALGIFRFEIAKNEPHMLIEEYKDTVVAFEGVLYQEPEQRENGIRLWVAADVFEGVALEDTANIVTTVSFGETYRYGDRIYLEGQLQKPEPFQTENGRMFAYDTFLEKDGIFFTLTRSRAEVLAEGEGFWLKERLFAIKHALLYVIARIIPEPESALVGGIVFGVEDALGAALLEAFRRSGLIHIVVLSGFNVAIAADWFMRIANRLPERLRIGTGALGIVLFAIMTGASATTTRASIMALLALLARSTANRYNIMRALSVAAICMVLYNPYVFIFDLSFQLSVLATLGLIFIAPVVEEKLTSIPEKYELRGLVSATVSAQIAVAPLIAYKIGELSVVGVIANVLVLPVIPIAMGTGFFTGVVGSVALILATPLGFITYGLLAYVVGVAEFVASLPGAALTLPPFPWWVMIGVYMGVVIYVYTVYRNRHPSVEKGGDNILGLDV